MLKIYENCEKMWKPLPKVKPQKLHGFWLHQLWDPRHDPDRLPELSSFILMLSTDARPGRRSFPSRRLPKASKSCGWEILNIFNAFDPPKKWEKHLVLSMDMRTCTQFDLWLDRAQFAQRHIPSRRGDNKLCGGRRLEESLPWCWRIS